MAELLETPTLLLDLERLDANILRMRNKLAPFNVVLRPHVKTNKSLEVTERLFAGGRGPITVSTLREADFFFAAGFVDILYGVGIAPNKFDHAARLIKQGLALKLVLDNLESARLLANFARSNEQVFEVLLEIDCDGHRSGIPAHSALLVEIAQLLRGSGVTVSGVMTHAGNAYDSRSIAEIEAYARQERAAVVDATRLLDEAGFELSIVSIGSTPTALFTQDLSGITEVRAGVFAFFDLVMAGLGVCQVQDIAVSVLTTVIGHQSEKGWTIVDAGWMALSRDRGTARQSVDQGYGIVCDLAGQPIGDLIVSAANQEHGIISSRSGNIGSAVELSVGTQLRILPNHACATSAQHAGYHVLAEGRRLGYWSRISGW
ncbi:MULTISPECIES: alanine racemase [unclassified Pseudomonas]|uniref:alanine racemase n=1 Tax=unclassified Pseudomonas TaxID=196821 RepID=UPI0015A19B75|nr:MULTISPECIES: alanine racemase [unclassified Pseudomonas]NWC96797.1 alanine racemase [Pseudomonas sp. IPO3779]NWD21220.1 alanine racemase [Pseudomonas sp. IPO3778]